MEISNVVSLLEARQSRPSTPATVEGVANPAHVQLLPFRKRAHVHASKAQHIAPLRGQALMDAVDARMMKRKAKAVAPPERLSKAECNARIRSRIADVAMVLNLSGEATKPALSLKHEHLAAFAAKQGVKIEWLIAGTGGAFRSRGPLYELAVEFERLLKIEKDLRSESGRRRLIADRLAFEKLGVDPDDRKACDAVHQENFEALQRACIEANDEIGTSPAWSKWNSAVNRRLKVGKEIMGFGPVAASRLGLMIRLRVIEIESEDRDGGEARMLAEVRAFFRKFYGRTGKAADCGN